ncbi:MAG: hypothetical protein HYS08_04865 [Chlamydiae bacterium]|nr:hypothetical protein [Chlamydiota bacterium]MBI3265779.1 hypothetical protein [Chlamydiota bacterium]
MKATLVYWHKARLQGRYVLEMEIYQVGKSTQYKDGVKYGLILTDTKSGKRVLMDNHHPKGPHVHLDSREISYEYFDEEKLIQDFKSLVLEHLGVKL